MTWQEAVRRAAQGGCPLLKVETNSVQVKISGPFGGYFVCLFSDFGDKADPVLHLTAVMTALAWYWDKTDECTDNEYSAYMESIRSLRARRAELEKEL